MAATYRERRLAKAERLRGWAEQRESRAAAALESVRPFTEDYAFNTQPGHIPGRDRVIATVDRAYASLSKAESMTSRAEGLQAAAEQAIYSDDGDAPERLAERIAVLEAERDRIKAYNASCRKGQRDVTLLDEHQQSQLASIARVASFQIRANGAAPSYWTTNLSSNINRQKKRLEGLSR